MSVKYIYNRGLIWSIGEQEICLDDVFVGWLLGTGITIAVLMILYWRGILL